MDPTILVVIVILLVAALAGYVYYRKKTPETQTSALGTSSDDVDARVGTTSTTQTNAPSDTAGQGPDWVPPENFIFGSGNPSGEESDVSYSLSVSLKSYAGDHGIYITTPTTINSATVKFLRAFVRGARLRIHTMKGKEGDIPFDKLYTLAETLSWHPQPGNASNRLQLLEKITDPAAPTFIPEQVTAVLKIYE